MYVLIEIYSMFTKEKEKEKEKLKETRSIQIQWLPSIITKWRVDFI